MRVSFEASMSRLDKARALLLSLTSPHDDDPHLERECRRCLADDMREDPIANANIRFLIADYDRLRELEDALLKKP